MVKKIFFTIRTSIVFYMCLACGFSVFGKPFRMDTAFADTLISVEDALKKTFPKDSSVEKKTILLSDQQQKRIEEMANVVFDSQFDREFNFYTGRVNGQVVGFAAENTVHGKWGPIHYLVGFDLSGKITNVIVLSLEERRGRPVSKPKFLKQFIGKTDQNQIRLRQDIQGISGATISSRGMTDGIRKMLYILEEFRKTQNH